MAVLSKLLVTLGIDATAFNKGLDQSVKKTEGWNKKLIKTGAVLSATVTTPAVLGAKKLLDVANDYDALTDSLAVGTGKTGAALGELQGIALNVFKTIPTSMDAVGSAMVALQQKTGATGKTLETLTKQQLELARITGTDVVGNIKSTTDAFNNWGVAVDQQSGKLDELFTASQKTGVPVASLADQLATYGPILRQLGFGFDEATALIGTLGKAGLDTGVVVAGLKKAFVTFAKEGVTDTGAAIQDIFTKIKDTPDALAASQAAIEIFGNKAGPALAESIRSGKLEYQDLLDLIKNGGPGIIESAASTNDLAESWQIFKNRLAVDFLPLAMKLFTFLNERGIPALEKIEAKVAALIKRFDGLSPRMKTLIGVFAGIMVALGPVLIVLGTILGPITTAVGAIGSLVGVITAAGTALVAAIAPIALPLLVIVGVLALIGLAYKKNFLGFADGVHRFVKYLRGLDFRRGALGDLIDIFQDLGRGDVMGAVRELTHLIRELGDTIETKLASVGLEKYGAAVAKVFRDVARMIGHVVSFFDDLVHGRWREAWSDLVQIGVDLWRLFIDYLKLAPSMIIDIFNAIPWSDLLRAAIDFVTNTMLPWFASIPQMLYDLLANNDVFTMFYDAGHFIFEAFAKAVIAAYDWFGKWFSTIPAAMVDVFSGIFWGFYRAGQDVMQGLIQGVASLFGTLSGWVDGVIGLFQKIPGLGHSPWPMMIDAGRDAMTGLILGWSSKQSALDKAIDRTKGSFGGGYGMAAAPLASAAGVVPAVAPTSGGERNYTFNVSGAADPEVTARAIMRHIRRAEAGGH